MFIVITLKIGEIIHKLILKYLLWYIKTVEALKNEKLFISGLIIFIIFFASGAMTFYYR